MIGAAALAIWFDVEASGTDDVEAWYRRQHLPERLSVPGFLRGRRYARVEGERAFFTLYETRDRDVLASAPYLERLNDPTEWTRRALPTFRGMIRNVYQRLAAAPTDAPSSHVVTVRIKPDSGRGPYVREWLERDAPSAVGNLSGVVGWATYLSDSGGTSVMTEERKLVGDVSAATPFLAVLELNDPATAGALRETWPAWGRKMAAETAVDVYRLMYGLGWIAS